MGFRLTIETADKKEFGDDHKLYGYWKFEEVKDSFMVLYPLIKEQWSKLQGSAPECVYNIYFCCSNITDPLVVSDDIFVEFAKNYIADLITTRHDPGLVSNVALYLTELCYRHPGDKVLSWS